MLLPLPMYPQNQQHCSLNHLSTNPPPSPPPLDPSHKSSRRHSAHNGSQVRIQRPLLPEVVDLLFGDPVSAVVGDLHIEVPKDAGENESHLDIGEAGGLC